MTIVLATILITIRSFKQPKCPSIGERKCNEILPAMKNKQEQQKQHANIGSNVHESHRHYGKQRNLDLKACILYESVYVKFRTNKTNIC